MSLRNAMILYVVAILLLALWLSYSLERSGVLKDINLAQKSAEKAMTDYLKDKP